VNQGLQSQNAKVKGQNYKLKVSCLLVSRNARHEATSATSPIPTAVSLREIALYSF